MDLGRSAVRWQITSRSEKSADVRGATMVSSEERVIINPMCCHAHQWTVRDSWTLASLEFDSIVVTGHVDKNFEVTAYM